MKQTSRNRFGAFSVVAVLGFGGLLPSCVPRPPRARSSVVPTTSTIVQLVNQQRAAAGVGAVTESSALDSAALTQSYNQAIAQLMSHTGPDGSNAGQRITDAGYSWSTWGENVAAGQPTVNAVMTAWMNSPPHRANILSPAFTNIGLASLIGSNGVVYWTMELAGASR